MLINPTLAFIFTVLALIIQVAKSNEPSIINFYVDNQSQTKGKLNSKDDPYHRINDVFNYLQSLTETPSQANIYLAPSMEPYSMKEDRRGITLFHNLAISSWIVDNPKLCKGQPNCPERATLSFKDCSYQVISSDKGVFRMSDLNLIGEDGELTITDSQFELENIEFIGPFGTKMVFIYQKNGPRALIRNIKADATNSGGLYWYLKEHQKQDPLIEISNISLKLGLRNIDSSKNGLFEIVSEDRIGSLSIQNINIERTNPYDQISLRTIFSLRNLNKVSLSEFKISGFKFNEINTPLIDLGKIS